MIGLDLLRAIAILFVITSHSKVFFTAFYPFLNDLSLFGWYGVEIFFVLSGFLIGGILIQNLEKNIPIKKFLLKRWFRTMPNYYLFLLTNFLVYVYIFHKIPGDWHYVIFLQNFSSRMDFSFFPESWSLSVEEWFYIFISFLIYGIASISKEIKKTLPLIIFSTIILSTLYRAHYVYTIDPLWDIDIRKVVIFRFDSLLYGILAAYFHHFYFKKWLNYKFVYLFFGLSLILLNAYFFISYYPGTINTSYFMRTYYFTITSLSIALCLPCLSTLTWSEKYFLPAKIVTFISLISYSLYLTHFLLKGIFLTFFQVHTFTKALFIWGIWLSVSFLISYLIYKYFEKPLIDFRNKFVR